MSSKINGTPPSPTPLPQDNSSEKTSVLHKGRAVKRAEKADQSVLDSAPSQTSPVSRTVSTSRPSRGFTSEQLHIVQRLILEKKWQAAETAFGNYATDLTVFKQLLSKLYDTTGIPNELYSSIEHHFSTCFVREKAPILTAPALTNESEDNAFVRYETINRILGDTPLATDNPIKTVARTTVDAFLDGIPDTGIEKATLEERATLEMAKHLKKNLRKLNEDLTSLIQ
ncbi:MAG: hypothetical protein ACPG5T_02425 [Endozoicomonas sp.]